MLQEAAGQSVSSKFSVQWWPARIVPALELRPADTSSLDTMTMYITAGDNKASCTRISKVIHRKQGDLVTATVQFLTYKFLLAACIAQRLFTCIPKLTRALSQGLVSHLGCDIYFSTQDSSSKMTPLDTESSQIPFFFQFLLPITCYFLQLFSFQPPHVQSFLLETVLLSSALPWSREDRTSSSLYLAEHGGLILKYKCYPTCMKKNMLSELKLLCFLHCQEQTKNSADFRINELESWIVCVL